MQADNWTSTVKVQNVIGIDYHKLIKFSIMTPRNNLDYLFTHMKRLSDPSWVIANERLDNFIGMMTFKIWQGI